MAACALGASVKPGIDPASQLWIDRSLWETLVGAPSSWMDFIFNILAPSMITASNLCALNLDDPPLPSLSDIASALQHNPAAIATLLNYVSLKLSYVEFANVCVCNAAAGPCYSLFGDPFSSFPDYETAGAYSRDIGMKVAALAACDVTSFSFRDIDPHAVVSRDFKLWDLTTGALLWTQPVVISSTAYQVHACTTVTTLISGHDYVLTYRWVSGDSVLDELHGYGGVINADMHSTGQIDNYPSGVGPPTAFAGGLAFPVQPLVCPATSAPTVPVQPTQPPNLILPPDWSCATACDIMVRLQQLSDRLDWLRQDVTLIQRQAVPFGYVLGTVHSGLTGSGTLSVQGILGVHVHLSTVPVFWGLSSDYPQRWIPAPAMVSPGTSDGAQDTHFVHFADELWFPSDMGAMTRIYYEFKPGCGGSITELLREP